MGRPLAVLSRNNTTFPVAVLVIKGVHPDKSALASSRYFSPGEAVAETLNEPSSSCWPDKILTGRHFPLLATVTRYVISLELRGRWNMVSSSIFPLMHDIPSPSAPMTSSAEWLS